MDSTQSQTAATHPVLLYDGVCGLCNRGVQFILKRDRHDVFRFASLQSEFAARVLSKHGINPETLDTVYLVLHQGDPTERLLSRSDAGLAVMLLLGGIWRAMASVGSILPRFFRDFLYNLIARNRYRIFGKYDTCPLPTSEQRAKFLDQ
ncbi:MAG TPA: DCC1-like thiol-disulfide oxidoreductase family protein [Terriglobales bacterium]|nr:DCC1-like thiol-disulfide oxidoreductase family protein [Terriglobales bacterium]